MAKIRISRLQGLIVASVAIALSAWSGSIAGLAVAPFIVLAWRFAESRTAAFIVMFAYYLAAGRGLYHGAGVFFGDDGSFPAWANGAFIWLVPNAILALAWSCAWGKTHRGLRLVLLLVIVSVPPVGVFGWANPLTAAGSIFPGMGWMGLALAIALLFALATQTRPLIVALPFALVAIGANVLWHTPSATQWIAVDTHIGSARDSFAEFDRLQVLKQALASARHAAPDGATFVLPELVGGDWSMNRIWWEDESADLAKHKQTALIGAHLPFNRNRQYVNALVSIGSDSDKTLPDRVPVPISMWTPFSGVGARASWLESGMATIAGKRIATLICYEELLIWPVLISAAHDPDIYVGAANDWWAQGTSIPAIQREVVTAWARLFNRPSVWAHNE